MTVIRNRPVSFAALLCGVAMAAPIWAAPAMAQGAEEAGNGNDIIVTAQRRSERLVDVPMTVTAVNPETLAATGVNTVRDLQNVTTGFQIGNSGSIPQPAIRGITTTNAGSYENNVALFVDGLYQTNPAVLNMDLPNVQDIQILKGPQGTLYGRNATGGAILINTIDPGSEWQGNVEATYGRFNDYRGRAFVAGPLSDKVGVSLAGTLRHTDGYYNKTSRTTPGQIEDSHFLGLKQESIRAKLKFDLTDSFRATIGYNYVHADDPRGVLFTPIENVPNSYTVAGRNTRATQLGDVSGDVFTLNFRSHEGMVKLELDTGIGTIRSVTGYTNSKIRTTYDFNGSYVPDLYSDSDAQDRTWQENLDFTINAIKNVDLVIGGNYYNIKTNFVPGFGNSLFLGPASYSPFTYPDPATTTIPIPDASYRRSSATYFFRTKEAWALFADVNFHATNRLTINVGGRYSEETQDVSGYKINYCTVTAGCSVGGNLVPTGGVTSVPYSINGESISGFAPTNGGSARTSHYSKFTPRATIRYEISPQTNIYASYSKGFRGGEWNSVIPSDNPNLWFDAKQETIDAYEIGFKTSNRRLHFEVAGFYYNYKDLQVSNTQQVGNPPVALVILANAPKAKVYGADLSFDYKLTDNFTVRGGATWLHARYGDGFYLAGTGVNPVVGFTTNSDPLKTLINTGQTSGALAGISVTQDLSGQQMSRAPDFTGFLGFEYNIPHGDGGLKFTANVKYTSSYVVTNPSVWGGDRTYAARLSDSNPNNDGPPVNTEILAGTPYVSAANTQRARQSGYALVNASVTWTDPTGHYYARVWGNNLTDQKYRTHYNPLSSGTYSPIGEPLTFGGTIGYKF